MTRTITSRQKTKEHLMNAQHGQLKGAGGLQTRLRHDGYAVDGTCSRASTGKLGRGVDGVEVKHEGKRVGGEEWQLLQQLTEQLRG